VAGDCIQLARQRETGGRGGRLDGFGGVLLGQTVGEFSDVIDGGGVWDESAVGVPTGEPGG